MRLFQVECIVFRKDPLEFLLLKRIPEKGGFWQPPCGGVESDETVMAAAYREIEEESGIRKDQIIKVYEDVHTFEMKRKNMPALKEVCMGFEVKRLVDVNIKNNIYVEHECYCWASYGEALGLLKWADNKEALKKLHVLLVRPVGR